MANHTTPAELALKLRRAVLTASHDDYSRPGTNERLRHIDRIAAMENAAEFLEALQHG